jgi:transposase-like protein
MKTEPSAYRGFRFPAEIISHAVWLYRCFSLSLREAETILAQRGVEHRQSRHLNNRARSRTSRHGGENGRCSASSRRGMPSGSFPATAGSTIISSSVATS